MNTSGTAPGLMTVQDVAERLKLSESTVYALMRDGRIPAVKIGSQWRVEPVRLQQWLDAKSGLGPDVDEWDLDVVVDAVQGAE